MARDSIEKKPSSETKPNSPLLNVSSPKGPVETYQALENQKLPPAQVIRLRKVYGDKEQRDSKQPIPLDKGSDIRPSGKRKD